MVVSTLCRIFAVLKRTKRINNGSPTDWGILKLCGGKFKPHNAMLVSKSEFASLLVANVFCAAENGTKTTKVVRAKTLTDLLSKATSAFKEARVPYAEVRLSGGAYYPISRKGVRVSLGEPRTEVGDLKEFRNKMVAAIGEC